MSGSNTLRRFYGPNAGYVLELYDRYLNDPSSVDPETRAFFEQWTPESLNGFATTISPAAPPGPSADVAKVVGAANLAQSIRKHGHQAAQLDPLGSTPVGDPSLSPEAHGLSEADLSALTAAVVGGPVAEGAANAAEAIARLRELYCATTGYDFDHVEVAEEREWLLDAVESGRYRQPLSADERKALLQRLTEVESFERFLHRTFIGQKRFSIEGTDIMVPMIDEIIKGAIRAGTDEVMIAAAHRGRLNLLAHTLAKPYAKIIAEFMGRMPHDENSPDGADDGWTGDVKYHLGARRPAGELPLRVTMAANPSHLEYVNPVLGGMTRAAQETRDQAGPPKQNVDRCLSVVLHGDAAFPGEGIVSETLNLSRLPGYQVGGTLHIIANNQIGFTAEPWQARSTYYASDLARGFEIPVIHVNADDPEACVEAMRLGFDYRQQFHKDFLIDVIGYRRWGHNEGEEPAFTQPLMYDIIRKHPTVRELWARELDRQGVVPKAESDAMVQAALQHLQEIRDAVNAGEVPEEAAPEISPPSDGRAAEATAVPLDTLRRLNQEVYSLPDDFHLHPKLGRQMQRRIEAIDQDHPLEWGHVETLAFASILADGTPIRLTGQDVEPGTFSQRHLVFHDVENGNRITPLQRMPSAKASFAVFSSALAEASPLGFEYGYSIEAAEAMVIWEAQYGDFANAGQVMFDQFIVAARAKWREHPSLTILLPHGYEGPEPEHSSGRIERFLQLAAADNIIVANCSTAANYFHLLREHAGLLLSRPRPLVVMTPKSLLRHASAASPASDLAQGGFQTVIDDPLAADHRDEISRLILCSGKVYVDLTTDERREAATDIAIVRIEQLYPYPEEAIRQVIAAYPNLRDFVWLQEEPRNIGAWAFMQPRLRSLAEERNLELRYVGRHESASPAEGVRDLYKREQQRVIDGAFAEIPLAEIKTYGVKHAD